MNTKLVTLIFSILMAGLLSACTTAMYTKPTVIPSVPNTYNFTIETGGFSGAKVADQRAIQEIEKFMGENNYKRYEIVQRKDIFIPSGFKYIVKFYRQ
jgi:hypothetical protein